MNADRLLSLGLDQLWQLTLVIAVIGPLAWWLGRRRPHWAYALWLVVLVKAVTPPLWSSPTSVFSWLVAEPARQAVPSGGPPMVAAITQAQALAKKATPVSESTAELAPLVAQAEPPLEPLHGPALSTATILLAVWAAGAIGTLSIAGAMTTTMLRRLGRTTRPPDPELLHRFDALRRTLGATRRARLVISGDPLGPALVGLFWPRVVLPEMMLRRSSSPHGSAQQLEPILAHELIHLRRGDHWVAHLQLLVQAVWWFHPLVWWANRQLGRAREMSCDEEVLAGLDCQPADYAQRLLDVVRLRRQLRAMPLALGMQPAEFAKMRLGHIMRGSLAFQRRTPRACWAMVALVALALLPGAGLLASGGKDAKDDIQVRTVVDGDTGKLLAGVHVKVDHILRTANGPKIVATTEHVTDKQGKYEIKIPAAEAADPTLGFQFHIDQPGYAPPQNMYYGDVAGFRRQRQHGLLPASFDVDRIFPGEEVTGVIADPQGKPLADLPVHVASQRAPSPDVAKRRAEAAKMASESGVTSVFLADPQPASSYAVVRTDAKGRFKFNALKGGTADFWIEPPGFATLTRSIGAKRGDLGQIVLNPGTRVGGRVVDAEGKPVPKVWVKLRSAGAGDPSNTAADRTSRAAKTDAEGNFRTEPVHPGNYLAEVTATQPSWLGALIEGNLPGVFEPTTVEVKPGEAEPRLDIKAIPHYTIRARFTDSTGKPFAGAVLVVNGRRPIAAGFSATDFITTKAPATKDGDDADTGQKPPNAGTEKGEVKDNPHDVSFNISELTTSGYMKVVASDGNGVAEVRVPRDLADVRVSMLGGDQDNVYRRRVGPQQLWNMTYVDLGKLTADVEGLEYVHYSAPSLWFTIVDPAGKPIENADGRIDYLSSEGKFTPEPSETRVYSPGKGKWTTRELLPGQQFLLTVDAPGHQPQSVKLKLAEGEDKELKVVLQQ